MDQGGKEVAKARAMGQAMSVDGKRKDQEGSASLLFLCSQNHFECECLERDCVCLTLKKRMWWISLGGQCVLCYSAFHFPQSQINGDTGEMKRVCMKGMLETLSFAVNLHMD